MADEWFPFGWNLMMFLQPIPGVYELADEDGMTLYIGGADNLRSCFERLLGGSDPLGIRQHAKMCCLEYRDDFRSHVQVLLELFRYTYERDPIYNELNS